MPITFIPKATDVVAALDALGDDRIGIIYDVANGVFVGDDPTEDLRLVKDRLRLVHLSDTGTVKFRHDPVGQGSVPFAEVGQTLQDIGYEGTSILEIISQDPDPDIAESHRKVAQLGWEAPQQ